VSLEPEKPQDPLLVRCVAPPLVVLAVLGGLGTRRAREAPSCPGLPSWFERGVGAVLREVAAQDWLLVGYLLFLLFRVQTGTATEHAPALVRLGADLAVLVIALVAVRGGLLPRALARLVYRGALFVPVLGSFLQLEYILPAASRAPMDARLYAFDIGVFGREPAEVFDAWVSPRTTEWFAFFYYGYFFLIAAFLFPFLVLGRGRLMRAFGMGFLWVYCAGHAIYTLVPAYGPYAYLPTHFQHPLEGAFWWPLVQHAVASVNGAARTDVFPSLHTAVPTFLAAFSFKNRAVGIFRRTWPIVAFVASQMMLATMFLRWHYVIDVVAGLTLAASAFGVIRIAETWDASRQANGGQDVW